MRDEPSLEELRREVERAADHYYHSPQQRGIDNRTKRFVVERCRSHIRGPRVLELGYVDGLWTDVLIADGHTVDVVERASRHVEDARDRYRDVPTVHVFHALFQEHEPDAVYDTVIAGDMVRYLPDPEAFLRHARGWLAPNGVLVATVPNSRSLHRRVGALLGSEPHSSDSGPHRTRQPGPDSSLDRAEPRRVSTCYPCP